MNNVTTAGIDLAKNLFSVHGVDALGVVVLRKTVSRARLEALVAQWPACLIGMEACSGAHEWARRFQGHGHTVRLMAPKFVISNRCGGGRAFAGHGAVEAARGMSSHDFWNRSSNLLAGMPRSAWT